MVVQVVSEPSINLVSNRSPKSSLSQFFNQLPTVNITIMEEKKRSDRHNLHATTQCEAFKDTSSGSAFN